MFFAILSVVLQLVACAICMGSGLWLANLKSSNSEMVREAKAYGGGGMIVGVAVGVAALLVASLG